MKLLLSLLNLVVYLPDPEVVSLFFVAKNQSILYADHIFERVLLILALMEEVVVSLIARSLLADELAHDCLRPEFIGCFWNEVFELLQLTEGIGVLVLEKLVKSYIFIQKHRESHG